MEAKFLADEERGYQNFEEGNFENPTVEENKEKIWREEASEEASDGKEGNPTFLKIIRWLIYAAAFLTPLWFLPFAADGLEFDKQVLLIVIAGAGMILYLVDMIKSGIFKYRPSSLYLPVAALVGAGIVSVIFSVDRFTSVFGADTRRGFSLISLISLTVIFFLALNTLENKGKTLRKVITLSLALTLLLGVLQILGLSVFKGTRFAGNSFNTVGAVNALGMLAAVGLALFSFLSVPEDKNGAGSWFDKTVGVARYLGFALALFLLVIINWWVVWMVAFVSLLAQVAFNSMNRRLAGTAWNKSKMSLFALPMAIIVIGIFLLLINFNWSLFKSKLPLEVAPTYKTSVGIAVNALSSRPLGFGLENFLVAYDQFKPANIVNTVFYQVRFTDATAGIINFAVEGGILTILAFLSLLWFYGRELVERIGTADKTDGELNSVWAASLGVLAVFFLYPANLTFLTLLILLLALISVGRQSSHAEEENAGTFAADSGVWDGGVEGVVNLENSAKYSFLGSLGFIIGLVVVLVGWYFTVNNYIANTYLAEALASTNKTKAIDLFVKSVNSNTNDARTFRFLSQIVIVQLGEDLKNGPQKDESRESYNSRLQNQMASAVNVALQATKIEPADSQNWSNLAFVYHNLIGLIGGADQAAVSAYGESLKRNPADPVTYLRIGNVYLSLADSIQKAISSSNQPGIDYSSARKQIDDYLVKAEDNFKKAIALYNNFGQALYNLAAVYDRQGKLPEAIKQFEKLQVTNPRDPSVVFQLGLLYYRNNQKDNAFKAWQQAVVLFPNYSNARWYLSLVYEERGDLASALTQVREIEKLNPDNELVKQRITQLEAGRRTIPPEKVLDKKPL